ncbi:MAG: hypothetical protein KGQ57_01660 [Burkholderiales bacterium]|nr:hypothetical protein [Burkholderiales bacterium]
MAVRLARLLLIGAPAALLSACALVAPQYSPDVDNIETLKSVTNAKAHVGEFDSTPGPGNYYPVPLRANVLRSPVGHSFGDYLADAMTKELTMAGKLSPQSDVEIKATLIKNDIDVGIATGGASLSARFIVVRGGQTRFDKVVSAQTQWDSAFAAMIAVPKAREEYPAAVQKLLGQLYADPAFRQAIE